MVLDIIVIVIMVIPMVLGFRKGLVQSAVHILSWLGALAAAFLCARPLQEALTAHTSLDETIYTSIHTNLSGSLENLASCADTFPLILKESIDTAAAGAAEAMAGRLTEITTMIISFTLLFIAIKLVCFIIIHAASKKKNKDNLVGFVDGVLGLAGGMIKGLLLVFLLLMLMMPALTLMDPAAAAAAKEALDSSNLARTFYDANLLMLILS